MRKCTKCGNIIENDNAKFCKKCGTKLLELSIDSHDSASVKATNSNDGILLGSIPVENIVGHDMEAFSVSSSHKECSSNIQPQERKKRINPLWAIKVCFKKYAVFEGRASRSEYWYFYLFYMIIYALLYGLAMTVNDETISLAFLLLTCLFLLIVFLPGLAVTVRRLHDIGKSGWYYCISFIPIIGSFILLYYMCKAGDQSGNRYGLPTSKI